MPMTRPGPTKLAYKKFLYTYKVIDEKNENKYFVNDFSSSTVDKHNLKQK
jgi:hypothetical protein